MIGLDRERIANDPLYREAWFLNLAREYEKGEDLWIYPEGGRSRHGTMPVKTKTIEQAIAHVDHTKKKL